MERLLAGEEWREKDFETTQGHSRGKLEGEEYDNAVSSHI